MINSSFSIYDLEYFLLILVRVSCFVYICPFFSMKNTPRRVRVALSIFIAMLLYNAVTPAEAVVTRTVVQYAIVVIKEAVAGLLIGLSANICTTIFTFAGAVADMETGLSMVTLMDPSSREQISITGGLYNYAYSLILIASGMYRYLLGALADTFELIPVGQVNFNFEGLMVTVITFLTDYILIGFRIILPIFATMMMLNAILGVMAKVSPQMNMFAVGMQIKVLVGLGVLFLTTAMLPNISSILITEMQKMVTMLTESML